MKIPSFRCFTLFVVLVCSHSVLLLFIHRNVASRKCTRQCKNRPKLRNLMQPRTSLVQHATQPAATDHRVQVSDDEFHGTPFPGFNLSALKKFRAAVEKRTKLREYLFVTKNNTKLGEKFKCLETDEWVLDPGYVRITDRNFYNRLPRESPVKANVSFRACSVVGNAGILKNSSCGKEIDSSSFVFRSNFPPIGGPFEDDVGMRTHFLTANPSIFAKFYNNLKKTSHKKHLAEDLKRYARALVWTHPFHLKRYSDVTLRAHDAAKMSQNYVLFSHPKFLKNLTAFWKEHGMKAPRASTGLALATIAVSLCDQVTLYGFWPYPFYRQRALSYHYYDRAVIGDLQFQNKTLEYHLLTQFHPYHNFTEEFLMLQEMQGSGILKVQVGECQGTGSST
ncbi:PREDICTED: alpha-N-acetylneuraminide alpha-2,8-sialyltransferase-like [Branchiostoma belcheri]|uniref:Alpha-N-acetylneuraminide alpha-2,8-sialyltransferase-like n=1 Tax=Branchiostoma belcheri TaxID=7741 RepID=A0A6P4YXZ1_BRABE|nr:PREDICTED: alpha-N-acetylneuraminide alpha-2,8-sialyltransferase-like [Branchiostoma belcheri]